MRGYKNKKKKELGDNRQKGKNGFCNFFVYSTKECKQCCFAML